MKKIVIAALAFAAVAACNKAEVIETAPGEAIAFGDAFVDNATRATDPSYTANDIDAVTVYGTVNSQANNTPVVIYPGTKVERDSKEYGVAWSCPVNQYWVPGAAYKFVGIVDGNKTGVTTTVLENEMPTSISYKADGKTDLLCQTIEKTANTDGTANGLVAFKFAHLLSKVNFTVTNNSTEAAGYSFLVKNIKFAASVEGEYNVASAAWDADKFKAGEVSLSDITVATGAATAELTDEVLFLPGEVTISFKVDILYNGILLTTTSYPATGTYEYTLAAANAYNFNVAVSVGEMIQFTVTKQPEWTNGNTVDTNADGTNDAIVL